MDNIIFEQPQRDKRWRVGPSTFQGRERLSVWPWYEKDGEWFPCSPKFGGGFQVPMDRVPELIDALQAMMAGGEA